VTISDVAAAAGVQASTVSKALNGRGSADVRRRVEEAAIRLEYRPNQRARGLRRAESRVIGVLVPDLANPVFLPFLRGVESTARERGYVVLIADAQRSDAITGDALERFFDQGVDGLVLGGPVRAESVRLYVDHGVPIAPSASTADRNLTRHWERGEAAATVEMGTRLLHLGHRRFAFIGTRAPVGVQGRRYRHSRLGALSQVTTEAGAELAVLVLDPAVCAGACVGELRAVIDAHKPTAIVCANHLLAPWLLIALHEAPTRVPRDISVVLYGDSDWARAYVPALSVVSHDAFADGRDLATALLDTIGGAETATRTPPVARYIERASVGTAPRGEAIAAQ